MRETKKEMLCCKADFAGDAKPEAPTPQRSRAGNGGIIEEDFNEPPAGEERRGDGLAAGPAKLIQRWVFDRARRKK